MRREPFTPCTLRVSWGDVPPAGAFLVTSGGSAYRIERVGGRTLHCMRWPIADVPADAEIVEWQWARRDRRSVALHR